MKATRTTTPNSWRNIGKNCANMGWDISVALTQNAEINLLITEGFAKQATKMIRSQQKELLAKTQLVKQLLESV